MKSMFKQLQEIGAQLKLDCGDNSCLCAGQKGGMRTNGGCRCEVGQAVSRLAAELARFREREPLVQALLDLLDIDKGKAQATVIDAADAVRSFKNDGRETK